MRGSNIKIFRLFLSPMHALVLHQTGNVFCQVVHNISVLSVGISTTPCILINIDQNYLEMNRGCICPSTMLMKCTKFEKHTCGSFLWNFSIRLKLTHIQREREGERAAMLYPLRNKLRDNKRLRVSAIKTLYYNEYKTRSNLHIKITEHYYHLFPPKYRT